MGKKRKAPTPQSTPQEQPLNEESLESVSGGTVHPPITFPFPMPGPGPTFPDPPTLPELL
jgi:hypothetical protein